MGHITINSINTSLPITKIKTALKNIGFYKKKQNAGTNGNKSSSDSDTGSKLEHDNKTPVPMEERLSGAVKKLNAANEQRIVATTNLFAELDNDYKLLQEYLAFNPPKLEDANLSSVSDDTVITSYRGKSVEIKCRTNDDGTKLQEINFADGSKISYLSFVQGGKMNINGEEFDMPEGTIVETKSVQGRVFSQLIQTPDMLRNIVNKPVDFDKAEQILENYTPDSSEEAVLPDAEYLLNLLGNAVRWQTLSYLSSDTSAKPERTPENEVAYLQKSIEEGKLPKGTVISGEKVGGGKILTIPGKNCKYEVCGSEMRLIDNNGDVKLITRYEGSRTSLGLWVIKFDDGKPVSGSHYSAGKKEPLLTVNYTYNGDNTVTVKSEDIYGKKVSTEQIPSGGICIDIENGFKFVPDNKPHLGARFENQKPFQV